LRPIWSRVTLLWKTRLKTNSSRNICFPAKTDFGCHDQLVSAKKFGISGIFSNDTIDPPPLPPLYQDIDDDGGGVMGTVLDAWVHAIEGILVQFFTEWAPINMIMINQ
jgi:hypothetical protein